jgi:hypothetical protein
MNCAHKPALLLLSIHVLFCGVPGNAAPAAPPIKAAPSADSTFFIIAPQSGASPAIQLQNTADGFSQGISLDAGTNLLTDATYKSSATPGFSGVLSSDSGSNFLNIAGMTTLFLSDCIASPVDGMASVDPVNRALWDENSIDSIDWFYANGDGYVLNDRSGVPVLSWAKNSLYGLWYANLGIVATNDGNVYGYGFCGNGKNLTNLNVGNFASGNSSSSNLWNGSFHGNGAGLTNVTALYYTGITNSIPPANTTIVRAWVNFTNAAGGVFKMPLYQ